MSTEQEEAETAKAMASDAAAMEKLMGQTLDQEPPAPPPEPEPKPPTPPPAEPPPSEPPATPPPAEQPKAAEGTPRQDDFEKDLASDKYDLPAGSTKKAIEVNRILRQQATERHRMFRDTSVAKLGLEKEVGELKLKLEAAAKEHEELERYRPIVETLAIEQDPHRNARYNNEIVRLETDVIQKLRACGLDDATAKYIMEHGGPAYFSNDTVSRLTAEPERDGEKSVSMTHKEFWEQRVLNQLNDQDRRSIGRTFDDEDRVKDRRNAEIRTALSNREQYFKDLEAESKKSEETFKAECRNELNSQLAALGDLAKEKTIPSDATPEQKQRIETYNQLVKDATAKFDESFLDTSPAALVRKNLGRLLLDAMPELLKLKETEIAEWKAKHDAIERKWKASVSAANTSQRQSVQQQPKPLTGIEQEPDPGRRMERMMEELPA